MMKKGKEKKSLHPKLHLIEVTDADGNQFRVLSAKMGNITINSSRSTHSAWTGEQAVVKNNEKANKMNKFFI